MHRKLVLIAFILLAMMLLVGCGDTELPPVTQMEQLDEDWVKGEALPAEFNDARLPNMKGIAENDHLRLFVDDQSGAIAVLHRQSGEVWHSNPPERESDSIAAGVHRDMLSSQLRLEYYNQFGQVNAMNTFADSVQHDQFHFKKTPDGFSVTYQFGNVRKSAEDIPLMLSVERFEELSAKLDRTGQRALLIAYREDKDQGVYVRNDNALTGLQLDRALQAFEDAAYSEEDWSQDMAELNYTQERTEATIFRATIEYTLDEESLVVKVPVASIEFPAQYPVNNISVLNFFGAGGMEDEGAMFVPDGSGALIQFNNGKTRYPAYRQTVYGTDLALTRAVDTMMESSVRMPVFGIIREQGAFLGVIEEGDAAAIINADVSGKLNSYNYVYPSFHVINKSEVTLQANEQERTLPKFQEQPMKSDYVVRYTFLSGQDASYQGMAKTYREYLEARQGLPQIKTARAENAPFYVHFIGGIPKRKHFLGIPYRAIEPLTNFQQAKDILHVLKDQGIANLKLKYSGWFNGGVDHHVPSKIKVDRAVGGSKDFRELIAYTQAENIPLFPDTSLLMANSNKKFSRSREASRSLRGETATIYPLDQATKRRDRSKSPSYVVSPSRIPHYVDSLMKSFKSYELTGISLRDLADRLNSDYRKRKLIDRTESAKLSIEALQTIHDEGLSIMADGANVYAFPYLTDITNAPMANSGFKIEDESIPFYQMVIRGSIEYTGSPYNLSNYMNPPQYILKCLEYGAGVHFIWIYEPNYKVIDTEYDTLYAVNFELWLDQAIEMYHEVNEVLGKVQHERITGHEKLADGVYKTVYANGVYVIVNYNSTEVTVEGQTIAAESYLTGGGPS